MSEEREDRKRKLELFFQDIAEVMDRHGEIAARFVLAEVDEPRAQALSEFAARSGGQDRGSFSTRAAEAALTQRESAGPQKICIKYGVHPPTGEQICIQEIVIG